MHAMNNTVYELGEGKMRNLTIAVGTIAASTMLGACASTPPVTVNYHLPRADAQVNVLRSVACSKDATEIYVANTVTAKIAYTADPKQRYPIDIRALDGTLANTDIGVTLADDGQRLLGFNVAQTGQGSQIVDALVAVAGVALAGSSGGNDAQLESACEYIANNGKDGVLTLAFSTIETFDSRDSGRKIGVVPQDADRLPFVEAVTGELCLSLAALGGPVEPPVEIGATKTSYQLIKLRQPARMQMAVATDELGSDCKSPDTAFWKGDVMVPQQGTPYDIPLPKAAPFGKQSVTVGLSEAGALTSLKYGGESGLAPALGSAGKVLDLLTGSTPAQKAAALDAQADLIAQQERLLRCQRDPTTCTT